MKKASIIILVVTMMLILVPAFIVKADPKFDATLRIQDQIYTIGDPIYIELSVTHPEGYQVIFPKFEQNWGQFTVKSVNLPTKISNSDGTETSTQVVDARLFSPGTFTTPEVNLLISDENGNLNEITAVPISVTINSVLVEGDTQLRDIKPQSEIPYFNTWSWLISITTIFLLIGGFAYFRNHYKQKKLFEVQEKRTADEIALDELDHIESLKLPDVGRFKKHYTLTSICIRKYLEATFHTPFLERATFEIQGSFKQSEFDAELINKIINFLDESDLIKFSKFIPDKNSAYMLLELGREIIEITKPDPEITNNKQEADPHNSTSQNIATTINSITENIEVTP
jgi:hypothetical protein